MRLELDAVNEAVALLSGIVKRLGRRGWGLLIQRLLLLCGGTGLGFLGKLRLIFGILLNCLAPVYLVFGSPLHLFDELQQLILYHGPLQCLLILEYSL